LAVRIVLPCAVSRPQGVRGSPLRAVSAERDGTALPI